MQSAQAQNSQRKLSGKEAAQRVQEALAEAGLPRTSGLAGAEITGWTESLGSTGFSLRPGEGQQDPWSVSKGKIDWHIVISGKPHLAYEEYEDEEGDTLHEPIAPGALHPQIRQVFERLGLKVTSLRHSGHQTLWDDDVNYNVVTDWPDWIAKP